ncbi:endonuclease [Sediminicola sp. YIK13]|uniref:DNA/RNA non-specific endonuclease n=1 Tax=Sediminicola sp. YIK13 TaxID=1453352 RepID=UPI0007208E78|nr:DNA/RNA non-specific endonuclease [Sediminicola sp. YIK13]ALM08038.1 endonuclease [Sediminicola sp. YIK13]
MKKRNIYTLLTLLFIVAFWLFDNFYETKTYEDDYDSGNMGKNVKLLFPTSTTGVIIDHNYYSLSYSEPFEQAEWVAYELKKEYITYDDRKRPYFIEDPRVRTKSADWKNYRGSGYDRGHLCPAGDMRFSEAAYNQTFYTSNISPQENAFNGGIWNRLEQKVRYWTKTYDSVFVVTGGVLEEGLQEIGEEDVAVPKLFYKIIAKGNIDNLEVLGFLMPHKDSALPLEKFLVPVDSLETLTGIDFFEKLPNDREERLEKEVHIKGWKF